MVQDESIKSSQQKARDQKRMEKEKEKAARQALAAVAKGMKKENWMEYMKVLIDCNIAESKGGTEIITTLELEGIRCETVKQPLAGTISFVRDEMTADDGIIHRTKVYEDTVLLVEQAENIAERVQRKGLVEYISQCTTLVSQHGHCGITLLVLGFDKLMKSKRKGVIKRVDWEQGLIELQMKLSVSCNIISNNAQMVENIRMYCKSLGERPHKLKQGLFIGAAKNTLFIDKDGGGYKQVFIAQLQEIRSVNEAIATAVAQQYPSPVLLSGFIERSGTDAAVSTIADIPVRRGVGVLANVRRVGPEAAKRIVLFYNSNDPEQQMV